MEKKMETTMLSMPRPRIKTRNLVTHNPKRHWDLNIMAGFSAHGSAPVGILYRDYGK